ncbi:Glyoxalase/Bleomycin resistance protein/Dioxygenase superfamily protein [Collimonas sp. OK607]|uniref:VOC family protein n=1 Tax=Collimonas sp. OK607 TaxID=1798194 RepID=UPI0008E78A14|nr:VOC family protein [Collimonas sp. OK607]SFB27685.1 Glyoxalase/Bleomycin resistance protein/Dioxygenase superfamily protein [Collimonas sp. OK607]
MNILGPDELVFGVDDIEGCCQYLQDYGLQGIDVGAHGGRFEAMDGTAVVVRRADDPALPPAIGPAPSLRETVYGVADAAALKQIHAELSKDRELTEAGDGSLHCFDDMGFALGFRVTTRRSLIAPPVLSNAPGAPPQRGPNKVAVDQNAVILPRTLSHVVYFVPDVAKAEAFYVDRLGFRPTDRFTGVGPFLQPAGTLDHHTLFLIQTPPFMKGCDHFTFHLGSGTDVLLAGTRFVNKGYQSFWGPGRHLYGSNWFWYFNSPLGCKMEYDADMDLHDANWLARESKVGADTSQLFLFSQRDKWFPGDERH